MEDCGKTTGIARKALAAMLAAALCCFGTPVQAAFGADADAPAAAPDASVGARTVEELLAAGPYVEGRVLARVTSEFNPVVPYANDGGFAIDELYAYEADASAQAAGVRAFATDEPDRVVLIESSTQSTEELLRDLAETPGVVMAEPDYVGTVDDREAASPAGAGGAGEAAAAFYADSTPAASSAPSATPDDPLFSSQYHLQNTDVAAGGTNVQALWQRLWGGSPRSAAVPSDEQVVIAVLDTGVDYTHPDLENVMWDGGASVAPWSGVHGYDFGCDDPDPLDDEGHGTHVAGIVAAEAGNALGVAGMAPNARIMALRIVDEQGSFLQSSQVRAYQYLKLAEERGVHVTAVNNSWGGSSGYGLLTSVFDDLYRAHGVISVCSTGNSSNDHDVTTNYPSSMLASGIVSVNATGEDGALIDISDYGSMTTDLDAPGGAILSTSSAADASIVHVDEGKLAIRDAFDTEEVFFGYSPVQGEGYGEATFELAPQADNGLKPGGSGLLWSIDAPEAGAAFAIDLEALRDLSGNPPTTVAFDAKGHTVGSSPEGIQIMRRVHVSLKGADGGWIELDADQNTYIADDQWDTFALAIPEEARAQADWERPAIRIERAFPAGDTGNDVEFSFDNVAFAYDGAYAKLPYATFSGTSASAPVTSGALALLAAAYPDDSAAQRKARLLGSVARDEVLAGTCIADGRLDLARTDDPYPVISEVAQDAADPAQVVVRGAFFGEGAGAVTVEGAGALEVVSWSPGEVRATLPAGLDSAVRSVVVRRSDDGTGRAPTYLEGTAERPDEAFFEELPAPDFEALGVRVVDNMDAPWRVAAAGGKVYATSPFIGVPNPRAVDVQADEPENLMCLLVFDPAAGTWAMDERFVDFPVSNWLLCAQGDVLYLLDLNYCEVHRYDPARGVVEAVCVMEDPPALLDQADFITATMVCDGQSLWVVGSLVEGEAGRAGGAATIVVDLATGETRLGPSLVQGRAMPCAQLVDGALTVAVGGTPPNGLALAPERLAGQAFELGTALPASVRPDQECSAASAVLPAGAQVVAQDGSAVTFGSECLIVSGLVGAEANAADTYVYDPRADAWTALQRRLSPVKVSEAGGAYANGAFYVLGYDATGLTGDAHGTVFKRLAVGAPADDPAPPQPEEGGPSTLAPTGDRTAGAAALAFAAMAAALVAAGAIGRARR